MARTAGNALPIRTKYFRVSITVLLPPLSGFDCPGRTGHWRALQKLCRSVRAEARGFVSERFTLRETTSGRWNNCNCERTVCSPPSTFGTRNENAQSSFSFWLYLVNSLYWNVIPCFFHCQSIFANLMCYIKHSISIDSQAKEVKTKSINFSSFFCYRKVQHILSSFRSPSPPLFSHLSYFISYRLSLPSIFCKIPQKLEL